MTQARENMGLYFRYKISVSFLLLPIIVFIIIIYTLYYTNNKLSPHTRHLLIERQPSSFRPQELSSDSIGQQTVTMVSTRSRIQNITLEDIFITVKTTRAFHRTRLSIIIKTWFQLAKNQTWFFSDADDDEYHMLTNGHLINTNCPEGHDPDGLSCKMAKEFEAYIKSQKSWWCHFDDDNYVNTEQLVQILAQYDIDQDWYLGKPSTTYPLSIIDRGRVMKQTTFWFATGGAGLCISKSLGLKIIPYASNGNFIRISRKIGLPDDVTLGYIIEALIQNYLIVVPQFHSHLEVMKHISKEDLYKQISYGYGRWDQRGGEVGEEEGDGEQREGGAKAGRYIDNVIQVEDGLDKSIDPTRFLSLHCKLQPSVSYCPN
ncbi:unnamed protein product [Meganyctiphanes norvegica]|uniref:Fringe-like glycosyltransferase domain-containing protein n=1 Tax=Meganyctiphanes norvegica TaxID=48144 RepID=A0AAV2RWH4_MEGNR